MVHSFSEFILCTEPIAAVRQATKRCVTVSNVPMSGGPGHALSGAIRVGSGHMKNCAERGIQGYRNAPTDGSRGATDSWEWILQSEVSDRGHV
jgi:hypothetical protein